MAHWEYKPPVRQFFLSVACYVVKPEVQKFKRKKKCREQKETRCFQQKTAGFVELLSRFELETSSLPTAMAIFFTYFPLVYNPFCFISFAFQHSLKTAFPRVPHLSVAGYVVKKIVLPKEAVHKHNEALCNSLAFHLCISPFIPIDFRLLFRYCVACKSPTKR